MKRNKGFIGWLVLAILALASLKYFLDWSIFDAASTENGKATVIYVKEVLDTAWAYTKDTATTLLEKAKEFRTSR